jgi:hypothetical protein
MSDDDKPVPAPGEAHREDNELHYHDVDETNVAESQKPEADDTERPEPDE